MGNWDRGDDAKVVTDVSRPVTDEADAEAAGISSGDVDESLPGLEEDDGSEEGESSESGEWEIVDPLDDWLKFSDFDEIVPDRINMDVVTFDAAG